MKKSKENMRGTVLEHLRKHIWGQLFEDVLEHVWNMLGDMLDTS